MKRKQTPLGDQQIGQSNQGEQLCCVLGQATVAEPLTVRCPALGCLIQG